MTFCCGNHPSYYLQRSGQTARLYPAPPAADLTWVWGVMLASFAVGWLLGRASD
ncbi:MAG: hypothetical protein IT330_11455 [Anaerolineae bacterium]|nr:hypothetical protein [Anaerolineae bacterium]